MRLIFAVGGVVFPRLSARWALSLWSRTRRSPESAAGRQLKRDADREILSFDNVPVAVYQWGSHGPRVLFVHGWSGHGSHVAAFVAPLLEAGYRVIALDLPGHGETPGRHTHVPQCAAVIAALSEHYGPLHAVITHSYGGMVMALAMQRGVSLERAVFIAAPADVEFLLERFAHTLRLRAAVVDDMRRRMIARFRMDYNELASPVRNVRQLAVPALVIHDEDDIRVPWEHGQRIAAAWPGARFMKTSGLGHGRILRDTQVVQAATAFITGRQGVEA